MGFLDSRITEVSYTMASVLMLFAGDYMTDRFVIRRIRKRNILVRTVLFLAYVLLVLPLLTISTAQGLASLVLEPYRSQLWLILLGFFVLCGVLLSLKYRMKLF